MSILNRIVNKVSLFFYEISYTIRFLFLDRKSVIVVNGFFKIKSNHLNFNLGDDLNYYLLKELSGKEIIFYNHILLPKFRNYVCIGSVIDTNVDSSSIVWGAGALYGSDIIKKRPLRVCAVRGPLSRNFLLNQGIECPEIFGDPALLCPLVYKPKVNKKYKVGIIPHYIDENSKFVLTNIDNKQVRIIRMQGYLDWRDVLDSINECEFILSSSLHGIIISDAYNIPNLWISMSKKVRGNGFKFKDYYQSVGKNIKSPVNVLETTSLDDLIQLKKNWCPINIDLQKLIDACPFDISGKRQ